VTSLRQVDPAAPQPRGAVPLPRPVDVPRHPANSALRPVAATLLGAGATVAVALWATLALGGAAPGLLQGAAPPWWLAPGLRAVRDVAAVLTTGLLLVSSGVFSASGPAPVPRAGRRLPGTRWTVACSLVAAAAAAGHLLAVSATVSGLSPVEPGGAAALVDVLTTVEVTRLLAYAVIALLLVAAGTARARDALALRRVAAVAVLAVALLGVAGHAGGGHEAAMGVLAVHVLAASAWVGGLAALLLLRLSHDDVAALLPRYSRMAAGCLVAVAGSGVVAVALRWDGGGPDPTWALLAAVKLVLVGALVVLGLQQRRRVVARAQAGEALPWRVLVRLGLAELLLMAVAGGLGVALAGSAAG
jgi:putative copper export protein